MKISTLIYCTKEGMRNIIRNIWFSLASVAIISACIFLFCMFFGLIANVQYMVRNAESTVGITVFFNEDMSEDDIQKIGDEIRARDEVKEVKYVSAEEAWENFKKEYFKGVEDLAEGFADDNPLAGSASYEIYLKDIDMPWHGAGNPEDQLFERYGVRAFELQQDAGTFVGGDHRYSAGSCYLPYQQYDHDGSCI